VGSMSMGRPSVDTLWEFPTSLKDIAYKTGR
jgi:hypothetical protein